MTRLAHPARRAPKRIHLKPTVSLNNDINVTPLVDVVLVLLIIFMVVTPLLERQVSVQVPSAATVQNADPMPSQLVVSLDRASALSIDDKATTDAEYVDKLRERLQWQPERVVFFIADDGASYQKLIAAMDGAKRAGADKLAFVAEHR